MADIEDARRHDMIPAASDEQHFVGLREANEARQREWDKQGGISLSYRGNELAGEVGEACNIIKKIERERLGIRGSRATKAELADELSDVVICADLIAMQEGIDLLGESVPAKFNATSVKYGLSVRIARTAAKPTEDLPITLLCKLASITVHADEMASPDGHPFDSDALRSLICDPEVVAWVSAMTAAALAPRKRAALKETEI